MQRFRSSFMEIDLDALEQNYRVLSELAGSPIIPMVKADAYGHGDVEVAKVCAQLGAPFMGVALIEEGVRLRAAGISTPILCFCYWEENGAREMIEKCLTPILSRTDQIKALSSLLKKGDKYPVHLKINTGMNRLGFEESEIETVVDLVDDEIIEVQGICTHFAASHDYADPKGITRRQIERFIPVYEKAKSRWPAIVAHTHNSAAIVGGAEPRFDFCRAGIALYGAVPELHPNADLTGVASKIDKIKPVMAIKSHVRQIRKVSEGSGVSYDHRWTAAKESNIVTIPIGYADGVPRLITNKGRVLIKGKHCPLIGTICMDYILADVTHLDEEVRPGDEVIFLGNQGDSTIEIKELADIVQTNTYEILTGLRARLPREYKRST